MNCNEYAEYASALCDGEIIPPAAAEHIGACENCQSRMRDYIGLGVEMRRVASLESVARVPESGAKQQNMLAKWWQKGWGTMRIPRIAFAMLIAMVVVLASGLAIAKVGARTEGSVMMLKVTRPDGESSGCPLSTVDKKLATCAAIGDMNGSVFGYEINLLSRDGNRVELAIRTKTFGYGSGSYQLADIKREPQKQYWFDPEDTLNLDFPNAGTMKVTGEWLDHMPAFIGSRNHDLDPGPDELRVVSPLLLKESKVAGDLKGGTANVDKPEMGIQLYIPGQGLFVLSLSPIDHAVQANVELNRISFEDSGKSYVMVTGAPASRADHIWVRLLPNFRPSGQPSDSAFIGGIFLNAIPTP